ncbi:hypothetical protein H2198_008263 [Neophaeococcomyces mojaviensis]|uniref:Uncharacterized protein n=1 Tax=Neophaeococcomyces mojaviensis TaxID=3383035 RepID=A0ACC2ZY19_9EURO|nr:hypothetical protein H2198_008263 [Knufia sp. JES_112]
MSRSRNLSDEGLQCLASRLQIQGGALNAIIGKLNDSQLSIYISSFVRELQTDISYHPSRSTEQTSAANAAIIANCVQYTSEVSRASVPVSERNQKPLRQRMEEYRKAEFNIRHLLQNQFFCLAADIGPFVDINNGLPASHIAYLNGDKEAALELWKASRWGTDLLGRTFPHIVAEEGDLDVLHIIQNYDVFTLKNSRPDIRGLTVLAIVICMGHVECFDFLVQFQPPRNLATSDPSGIELSLLDLALASGVQHIVEEVVRLGYVLPPYTIHVLRTIELERAELASCLLPSLFQSCWSGQREIDELAMLARQKVDELDRRCERARRLGLLEETQIEIFEVRKVWMRDLARNLQYRKVMPVTVQQAISSLEAWPHQFMAWQPES